MKVIKDTWLKSLLNVSRIYARNFKRFMDQQGPFALQTYAVKGRILGPQLIIVPICVYFVHFTNLFN